MAAAAHSGLDAGLVAWYTAGEERWPGPGQRARQCWVAHAAQGVWIQRRELVDLNHVGAHRFVKKWIQGTKNKNMILIDYWYEASGLAGAPFFKLKTRF